MESFNIYSAFLNNHPPLGIWGGDGPTLSDGGAGGIGFWRSVFGSLGGWPRAVRQPCGGLGFTNSKDAIWGEDGWRLSDSLRGDGNLDFADNGPRGLGWSLSDG